MAKAEPLAIQRASEGLREGIALYVHIPFCETKCPYCDFNTYAGIRHLLPAYLGALCTEVSLWGSHLGQPRVNTVFLGGGTPSLLTPEELARVMEVIHGSFSIAGDAEVTVECNPDDLSVDRVRAYLRHGVNRVSIGVQSLDDRLLHLLGRRHSAARAVEAYWMVREAGMANVNLDLMYSLPQQTMEQWQATLGKALELSPEHLSLYCLTVEEGTPLARWVKDGSVPDPDPDLAADMYLWAHERLAGAGYGHYEISNWARRGFESRHNLTYWRNMPYLGVGPGAHSYLLGRRFSNLASPAEYIKRVGDWMAAKQGSSMSTVPAPGAGPVEDVEEIGPDLAMAETMMLGLRLAEGISLHSFKERFGLDITQTYRALIEELATVGLLELVAGYLRLTDRGRILGNEVFSRFIIT
ncbi:MAG: radical SAM family heme chaperone HemW [Chloroflexi bacterium]|nr:radical SAM family heme chaperone HemW [Chloroflexota bacterium]